MKGKWGHLPTLSDDYRKGRDDRPYSTRDTGGLCEYLQGGEIHLGARRTQMLSR